MKKLFFLSLGLLFCIHLFSQVTFRDNFIGHYNCTVKNSFPPSLVYYDVRQLYVTIDTAFPNRIVLSDSMDWPQSIIVNLYADSTFKDTIWSATGGLYFGHFYSPDSVYFHKAIVGGPGGLKEYFGGKMPTGINENKFKVDATIFPNPSDKVVNIDFKELVNIKSFEVWNSEGKLIQKEDKNISTTTFNLNTENWREGFYYITIKLDKGILKRKIVIQR